MRFPGVGLACGRVSDSAAAPINLAPRADRSTSPLQHPSLCSSRRFPRQNFKRTCLSLKRKVRLAGPTCLGFAVSAGPAKHQIPTSTSLHPFCRTLHLFARDTATFCALVSSIAPARPHSFPRLVHHPRFGLAATLHSFTTTREPTRASPPAFRRRQHQHLATSCLSHCKLRSCVQPFSSVRPAHDPTMSAVNGNH